MSKIEQSWMNETIVWDFDDFHAWNNSQLQK